MSVLHIKRGDGSQPVYRQLSDAIRSEIQITTVRRSIAIGVGAGLRYRVNRHLATCS